MSKQAVMDLLTRVEQDDTIVAELNATLEVEGDQGEAFLATAAKHGYNFTSEEFMEVVSEAAPAPDGELSEDDLGSVAGGIILDNGGFTKTTLSWANTFGSKLGGGALSYERSGPGGMTP